VEALADLRALLGEDHRLKRALRGGLGVVPDFVPRTADPAATRQAIDRHADRDLPQPGAECVGLAKLPDLVQSADEHFLREFLRFDGLAELLHGQCVHLALEAPDELIVSVAVPMPRSFHQNVGFDPNHGVIYLSKGRPGAANQREWTAKRSKNVGLGLAMPWNYTVPGRRTCHPS